MIRQMIDTHCHLTYDGLMDRLDDVLLAAEKAGVDRMISVGTTPRDVALARDLAQAHARIFFSVGVHPHYAAEVDLSDLQALFAESHHPRCVAFGEMGLDHHYDDPPRACQIQMLEAQLQAVMASGLDRPVIIHCRKAVESILPILRASGIAGDRFVFHCFTESPEDADRVLDFGAMLSFTGIVTYRNAPEVRASALRVPDDRIMVETDAPYLSPEPHRKVRPNEPRYVVDTARFLAECRGVDFDRFVAQVDANAVRFFGLNRFDSGAAS